VAVAVQPLSEVQVQVPQAELAEPVLMLTLVGQLQLPQAQVGLMQAVVAVQVLQVEQAVQAAEVQVHQAQLDQRRQEQQIQAEQVEQQVATH
jgi:hypothetical protein